MGADTYGTATAMPAPHFGTASLGPGCSASGPDPCQHAYEERRWYKYTWVPATHRGHLDSSC